MGKRIIRQSREQKLMSIWWIRALFALVFMGLAYAFVSLAIDSGSMLHWGLGFLFLGTAVNYSVHSIRYALDR